MNWEDKIYEQILAHQVLEEKDLQRLVEDYAVITIDGDDHRWHREKTTIICFKDKYYAINWMEGLTEIQDDYYYYDCPAEVERIIRPMTGKITKWVDVNNSASIFAQTFDIDEQE